MQVKLRHMGWCGQNPPAYRHSYWARAANGLERWLWDMEFTPSGTYELPDDQWDLNSMDGTIVCDGCENTYDGYGIKDTILECPYCGEVEVL